MAAAARNLTPLALELGGKSPNIVFPDADLDPAATMAALAGTALLSGQGCALPTRLYVHDDVYDDVVEKVVDALASLAVGDPLDPATFVGPVVTEAAMERILGVIDRARADGATLLTGGSGSGASWRRAGSWPPPCSATSTTTATWPATRSSDRSRPSCASPPRTRSWPRPTTARSGWPPTCTPVTRAASSVRPRARGRHRRGQSAWAASRRRPRSAAQAERLRSRGRPAGIEEMVRTKTVHRRALKTTGGRSVASGTGGG